MINNKNNLFYCHRQKGRRVSSQLRRWKRSRYPKRLHVTAQPCSTYQQLDTHSPRSLPISEHFLSVLHFPPPVRSHSKKERKVESQCTMYARFSTQILALMGTRTTRESVLARIFRMGFERIYMIEWINPFPVVLLVFLTRIFHLTNLCGSNFRLSKKIKLWIATKWKLRFWAAPLVGYCGNSF